MYIKYTVTVVFSIVAVVYGISIEALAQKASAKAEPRIVLLDFSGGGLCNGVIVQKSPVQVLTNYHCIQDSLAPVTAYFRVTTEMVLQQGKTVPKVITDVTFKDFFPRSDAKVVILNPGADVAVIEFVDAKLSAKVTVDMVAEVSPLPGEATILKSTFEVRGVSIHRNSPITNTCKMEGLGGTVFAQRRVIFPILKCQNDFFDDETGLSGAPIFLNGKVVGLLKGSLPAGTNNVLMMTGLPPGGFLLDPKFSFSGDLRTIPKWPVEVNYEIRPVK